MHRHDTSPLDPTKRIWSLAEISEEFAISRAAIRKQVTRGTIPQPTGRRDPEYTWDAATIWTWAVDSARRPLAAVPLRYWRHVIDHAQTVQGPRAARLHNVTIVDSQHGTFVADERGVHAHYGGLTTDALDFTLWFSQPFTRLDRTDWQSRVVVSVDWEVAPAGFFVAVDQSFEGRLYKQDQDLTTADIATLIDGTLPYWPGGLRHVDPQQDRGSADVTGTVAAEVRPPSQALAAKQALDSFRASQRHPNEGVRELLASLGAAVVQDLRDATRNTEKEIEQYVVPHQVLTDGRVSEDRYMTLAVAPTPVARETADEQDARNQLEARAWTVPVGSYGPASQAAHAFVATDVTHVITAVDPTDAQRAFLAGLVPVPSGDETLKQLSMRHPQSWGDDGIGREHLRDPRSGALVTHWRADTLFPEQWTFIVPTAYTEPPQQITAFDVTERDSPFIWTSSGAALPYPSDPQFGYSVGYGGTGPQTFRQMTARLLGLEPTARVTTEWPFERDGYPTVVTAEQMRDYFVGI